MSTNLAAYVSTFDSLTALELPRFNPGVTGVALPWGPLFASSPFWWPLVFWASAASLWSLPGFAWPFPAACSPAPSPSSCKGPGNGFTHPEARVSQAEVLNTTSSAVSIQRRLHPGTGMWTYLLERTQCNIKYPRCFDSHQWALALVTAECWTRPGGRPVPRETGNSWKGQGQVSGSGAGAPWVCLYSPRKVWCPQDRQTGPARSCGLHRLELVFPSRTGERSPRRL